MSAPIETVDPERPKGGLSRLAIRIAPELRGYELAPLLLLFALNAVDEFDRIAFEVLAPNIRDEFGLSTAGLGGIRALAALAGLAIPFIGFAGDRWRRVRMSAFGAAVWGVFAFTTGLVGTVWLLALVRFFSGTAKTVNEGVHNSLLADYYPPQARGRVFAVHRGANAVAAVIAPAIAGLIATFMGWKAAFLLMALPTFVFAYMMRKMREPVRGATDDADAAAEAAKEPPVPFGRAARWLRSVPTLKRIYVGAFFAGMGGIAYATYSSLYLEDVFGLGEFARGAITSAGGLFALLGYYHGGRVADRWQRTRPLGHLALFYGGAVVCIGLSLIAYAAAPVVWMAVVLAFVAGYFLGLWAPPYLTVIGFVSPARIRSLGFSYAGFYFVLGIIGIVPIGGIDDAFGIRWALVASALVLTASGFVLASAARFATDDVNRALSVLQTEVQLRQERLAAGSRSLLVVRDLDIAYEQVQVLFGVNFEVKEGELVALLGTNGAGKSTLLKAISGVVHPRRGAVFFDGKDITHLEPEETAELGVIQMPGGKAIFPSLTVRENLSMASWMYAKDREYTAEALARALNTFPVLRERLEQQAGTLSGGEQQMLSLAQAFMARPKLLMIDELSLGLAPMVVQQLMGIVSDMNAHGITIVLVEQSVNVALTVAQHAYFMEKGEIRFDGPTAELLERSDILRSVFLEGARSVVGDGHDKKRNST